VTLFPTAGKEGKRGGGCYRPPYFPVCFHGGAWRRRAATVQMPRNLSATIPAVAEGLPCNSCRFLGFIL